MADIKCLECNGESRSWGRGNGCICDNYGTIPDRRAATANEDALRAEVAALKADYQRAREAFLDWDNNQYPTLGFDIVRAYFALPSPEREE